ncbi:MAG: hypothetical protein GY769_01190 [bacterium]|nr:hypothetical protein [bacterium]
MRAVHLVVGLLVTWLVAPGPADAWVASAHAKIAEAAVAALPDSMPPFFRAGAYRIGRSAIDPDYYRLRDLPQLRNSESPEHYLDSELLDGAEWPESRYDYLKLVAEIDQNAYFVGTLPYSLAEGVQLLAASFTQVRLSPNDEWARAKALHHAGVMAHYAADLCQPLHTTIHYNGRARADGSSPRTGIHSHTDSLANAVFAEGAPAVAEIHAVGDLRAAIRREFGASHALVDRVYELEGGLGLDEVSTEGMAFARERVAASIRFTSSLFVTAWELSAGVSVPDWFRQLSAGR